MTCVTIAPHQTRIHVAKVVLDGVDIHRVLVLDGPNVRLEVWEGDRLAGQRSLEDNDEFREQLAKLDAVIDRMVR